MRLQRNIHSDTHKNNDVESRSCLRNECPRFELWSRHRTAYSGRCTQHFQSKIRESSFKIVLTNRVLTKRHTEQRKLTSNWACSDSEQEDALNQPTM